MEHIEFLILSRVYEILSLLQAVFPELSAMTLYSDLDVEEVVRSEMISYDNSPHYPALDNFPHHKHHHPKDKHSPVSFSGSLLDALKDIKWIISEF